MKLIIVLIIFQNRSLYFTFILRRYCLCIWQCQCVQH